MFTSADAAGAARCIYRPGSALTGVYRLDFPLGTPHPSYIADCQVRITPEGATPAQYAFPGSSNGYNLGYTYACKNKGQLDTRTWTCATPGDPPPQKNACNPNKGENESNNPVDFSTGQKLRRETDYHGLNGLEFTRLYMSKPVFDGFAPHWRHNFERRMFSQLFTPPTVRTENVYVLNDDGTWSNSLLGDAGSPGPADFGKFVFRDPDAGVVDAYLTREDGYYLYFSSLDQGKTWLGDDNANYKLSTIAPDANWHKGRYQLETPTNDKEIYDASNGLLLEIRFRDGRVQTLSYEMEPNQPIKLVQVSDNFGRSLKLGWSGAQLLKMTDPDGKEFVYGYDNHRLLTSVTGPDGLSRLYHYDEAAYSIPLSSTRVNGFMTGISDEVVAGVMVRWGIFKYDGKGLPVSSELAGGVDRFQYDYASDTATDALGTARKYTFQVKDGVRLQSGISQPAGAGCDPAATQKTYDANGNADTVTDYDGAVTKFTWYPGNLKKTRTEAYGTPLQRTTTWEWHPLWRTPVKIAAPKLLTTYEYDANGNLASSSEQATLDESGAQGLSPALTGTVRKTAATWNDVGQVMTETEVRDDREFVTVYDYDSATGNLKSVTTPAGLKTFYSNYNAHGDVGRVEDPNGNLVDFTYTLRRQIRTRTESGKRQTVFDYDGRGKPTQITAADGSVKTMIYDDAGRLSTLIDHFGNRIDFVLDNMGNRVFEVQKAFDGTLVRQVERKYDALNRLQRNISGLATPTETHATTTTLTSSDPVARQGYAVTLLATVSGTIPEGDVTFRDGDVVIGTAHVYNGQARLAVLLPTIGSHSLRASYGGDINYLPSDSASVQQSIVAPIASGVDLACQLGDIGSKCNVTLTLQNQDASWEGTTVEILEGDRVLGRGVVHHGQNPVLIVFPWMAVGAHPLQARFSGNVRYAPAMSLAVSFTRPAPPVLEPTFSCDVSPIFGPVACRVEIVPGDELYLPSLGSGGARFQILADDVVLGSAVMEYENSPYPPRWRANVWFGTMPVGTHQLRAKYTGFAGYPPALSAPQTFSRDPLPAASLSLVCPGSGTTHGPTQCFVLGRAGNAMRGFYAAWVEVLEGDAAIGSAYFDQVLDPQYPDAAIARVTLNQRPGVGTHLLRARTAGNVFFSSLTSPELAVTRLPPEATALDFNCQQETNPVDTLCFAYLRPLNIPFSQLDADGGKVQILEGEVVRGTGTVVTNIWTTSNLHQARIVFPSLPRGSTTLRAKFLGNEFAAPSVAAPITYTIP